MRPFHMHELMKQLAANDTEKPLEQSMEVWVKFHGAAAAAWLIWQEKKRFVKTGAVDFTIPKKAVEPPWFRVAIAKLRQSPHWHVALCGSLKSFNKTYRITWRRWRSTKQPHLSAVPS